jgi:hypothetical protein
MILGFAVAMMELLKVHMLASYLALVLGMRMNFAAFSLVFLASFALNSLLSSRSIKVFFKLLANAALGSLFVVLFFDPAHPFVSTLIIAAFFGRAWWTARSDIDHEFCVTRFDEGLAAFLAALGIAALVKAENPFPVKAALPYLAFSMLALGIAQGKKVSGKERFSKSHNATLASSILVLSLAAVGMAGIVPLTFLPAKKAGAVLGSLSLSLLHIIGDILEWLFRARKPISGVISGKSSDSIVYAERVGEEISTSSIFMWVMIGIFGVGALLLLAYCLSLLFRYLMSDSTPRKSGKRRGLRDFLSMLLNSLGAIVAKIAMFVKKSASKIAQRHVRESVAVSAYRKLLACGRIAGVRIKKTDTPREYSRRLAAFLPDRAQACAAIVAAVEKQAYGEIKSEPSSENSIRQIADRMRRRDYFIARVRFALRRAKKPDLA